VEAWPVIYTDSGSLGVGALSSISFYRSSSVTPTITVTNTFSDNFFITGALSPSVLTSSTDPGTFGAVGLPSVYDTGLYPNINLFGNVPNPPYAQTPIAGTGFNEPLSFTINPGDELRVSGSEGLVWRIASSSFQPGADPSINKSFLYVYLDRAYNGPHPINYFLIRRYVPNPSLVIINSTSSVVNAAGATGFLSPRYVSSTIQRDFNNIVQDLSSKNLI
jgi:hypothetical protein